MRRIGLIDCDFRNGNTFPNLALMKISAWHKASGDLVEWYMPFGEQYDHVYVSKVFSFTPDYDLAINAKYVERGGSGYQIHLKDNKEIYLAGWFDNLPPAIEHIYPDYELYTTLCVDTAYGFLTRGCPRQCSFCHTSVKDGTVSYKVADLREFWNGQKNIVLLDPNILACRDRAELLQQLIKSKAYIDFTQGLDARMLDDRTCDLLAQIKLKDIHFAWDRYEDGNIILPKLKMFAERKKIGIHKSVVYTLVNFDTTLEQDLERIYTLRDIGYWAYVMIYDKEHCAPVYNDLARWVNNRPIFARVPTFEQYNNKAGICEQKFIQTELF